MPMLRRTEAPLPRNDRDNERRVEGATLPLWAFDRSRSTVLMREAVEIPTFNKTIHDA